MHFSVLQKLRLILILMFAAALTGCVTEAEIDYRLSTWSGVDVDVLVSQWGAPRGSHAMKNGTKVYTFENSGISSTSIGDSVKTRRCQVNFVVDQIGKIQSSHWRGDLRECGDTILQNYDLAKEVSEAQN